MPAIVDERDQIAPTAGERSDLDTDFKPRSSASRSAAPKIPLRPKNPERICWGCDKYCPANDLRCGNGTIRTPHPAELFGDDWARTV